MEMQPNEFDVLQPFSLGNDSQHVVHVNTELVFCESCGNVGMCMGSHVRIQTEGDACHLPLVGCQFVDDFQFRDALYVETEDIVINAEIDFPVALAHTSEDNLRDREPSLDRGLDLTATHTVGSQSGLTDDAEHFRIGIGLDSIVHHESLVAASLFMDGT